ncbi:SDR family oxidoreductase [Macrococcoides caseolyticum]|uniref:SDR family oxidoreductase n=1 Tax=Macrococcoides caseolyticum TaxID=69966 RepID=UPI001F197C8C|nr:SDR family oxidoreductase [Macrococcus caseolyticus]MCE4956627.1 SDR family oxidoreductase [Macrococcus caseolyticus]
MMLPFQVDLKGKTAVVTGGAGVIGSYMSRALAECGANVVILGISAEPAEKLAEEIKAAGGEALSVIASVTDKAQLEAARKEINEKYGKVDILINGAGGNHPSATTDDEYYTPEVTQSKMKSFFDLDEKGVGFVFDLNFLGTFLPSQVFGQDMVGLEDATIINISSMNAFTPLTKIPAYSGAKSAVSNFTEWLSVYLANTNVRVNAIAPGFLLTDQNRALLKNEDGTNTPRTEKILAATPMNRFGEPEELIGALLFLVSKQASSFVNGVVLPVDGGFHAYSGV